MNISKISFTGLSNYKIEQLTEPHIEECIYTAPTGERVPLEAELHDYAIAMDLTDDWLGNNYSDLLLAVTKSGSSLSTGYFEDNPKRIELCVTQGEILNEYEGTKYIVNKEIKLNGQTVPVSHPQYYELYNYLFNLLIQLKIMFGFRLNDEQKRIVNNIGISIKDLVERFNNNRQ